MRGSVHPCRGGVHQPTASSTRRVGGGGMMGTMEERKESNQLGEGQGHTFMAELVSEETTKINPAHLSVSRTVKMSTLIRQWDCNLTGYTH